MGSLKAVLGFLVIAAVIYGSWLLIPPYFANYQFQDDIKNTALHDMYGTKSEEDIRQGVFKRAKALEIPLTEEQIKVKRTGNSGSGSLLIDVDYTVRVDMPGYPLDLHFHPTSENKGLY
jgi:hypothetical protein